MIFTGQLPQRDAVQAGSESSDLRRGYSGPITMYGQQEADRACSSSMHNKNSPMEGRKLA